MHEIPYRSTVLILFACLLALPILSLGQQKDNLPRDNKKTAALLCHTWLSNFAKSPQKMDCFPPNADSSIQFLTNGYIIFTERKGAEGVWNYDATRNNLYVLVNGNLWKYRIKAITATELVVEGIGNKNTPVYYLMKNKE